MSTLVYMRLLERTPESYDRGLRILTFGRIDRIRNEIATCWVERGQAILELGCGTGALAARLTARGARVVGIDVSERMLATARRAAPKAEFIHMTATEIRRLGKARFDRVIAVLSLSELSEAELDVVLRETPGLLAPGGRLILADEVPAPTWYTRLLARFVRWPLAALTFLVTRETTRAIARVVSRVTRKVSAASGQRTNRARSRVYHVGAGTSSARISLPPGARSPGVSRSTTSSSASDSSLNESTAITRSKRAFPSRRISVAVMWMNSAFGAARRAVASMRSETSIPTTRAPRAVRRAARAPVPQPSSRMA